ncbi:DUF2530 domain-containing protein [Streptomyces brasiliscabiei]|uniref:DUF2530 domain-containing protein n=1 Tax=Streptomyces brasiliscabiei TaxID=2736302 RepID=A0ABU8GPA0_9ACTN
MAKWTPQHEAPEPLEGPVVPVIIGGTILWLLLFVVQLPFYGWFEDHGHTWWVWTCLAGGGLGFIGIYYVRRRDAAIKRDAARRAPAEAEAAEAVEAEARTKAAEADRIATEATESTDPDDVTARPATN